MESREETRLLHGLQFFTSKLTSDLKIAINDEVLSTRYSRYNEKCKLRKKRKNQLGIKSINYFEYSFT